MELVGANEELASDGKTVRFRNVDVASFVDSRSIDIQTGRARPRDSREINGARRSASRLLNLTDHCQILLEV